MKKEEAIILKEFVKRLKQEEVTIDLGCGCGSYQYVAVEDIDDIFEEMVGNTI